MPPLETPLASPRWDKIQHFAACNTSTVLKTILKLNENHLRSYEGEAAVVT